MPILRECEFNVPVAELSGMRRCHRVLASADEDRDLQLSQVRQDLERRVARHSDRLRLRTALATARTRLSNPAAFRLIIDPRSFTLRGIE